MPIHKQRVARLFQVREILPTSCRRLVILNNYIGSAKDHVSWVVRSSVVCGWTLAMSNTRKVGISNSFLTTM